MALTAPVHRRPGPARRGPLRWLRVRRSRSGRRRAGARRAYTLGGVAGVTTTAVLATEIARVWQRGPAPLPAETDDVIGAAEIAARQTVEVAVEGYRTTPPRETALFNLLLSFGVTFVAVRATTHIIRARGRLGPLGNVVLGRHHIHHFVPGIALAFLSGGASVVSRDEDLDAWLAFPFGAGVALTLDESALLLELEDVYWTEAGVVSVEITLAALALLGAFFLALRLLRRGEVEVLASPPPGRVPPRVAGAPGVPPALG